APRRRRRAPARPLRDRLRRASSPRRGSGSARSRAGLTMRSRRAFLALGARALLAGGALATARPDRAPGREGASSAVTGRETFERLLRQAREWRWIDRPIGERI